MTLKQRITADAKVQRALVAAIVAQNLYQGVCTEMEPLLDAEGFRQAHIQVLESKSTAMEIATVASQLPELEGAGAIAAKRRAEAVCLLELDKFKAALPAILDAADAAFAELREEANRAEIAFFAAWDVEREITGVSKRLNAIGTQLKAFREGLSERQSSAVPNAYAHYIEWFRTDQTEALLRTPVTITAEETPPQRTEASPKTSLLNRFKKLVS